MCSISHPLICHSDVRLRTAGAFRRREFGWSSWKPPTKRRRPAQTTKKNGTICVQTDRHIKSKGNRKKSNHCPKTHLTQSKSTGTKTGPWGGHANRVWLAPPATPAARETARTQAHCTGPGACPPCTRCTRKKRGGTPAHGPDARAGNGGSGGRQTSVHLRSTERRPVNRHVQSGDEEAGGHERRAAIA